MPHELRQAYDELRQAFVASLAERALKLEQVWNHLYRLSWSEERARALQQFLHKLSGTSANYGFMEIRASSQYLAGYLAELLELRRQPGSNESEHLEHKIKQLKQAMLDAGQLHATEPAISTPAPRANKGQLVCVIDEDRGHAALLCHYLRRVGLEARAFDSLAQCQTIDLQPQALLLDADQHPDGLVSAVRLLNASFGSDQPLPILVMSARSDIQARLRALRAGCSDYLIKPLDFDLLQQKLLQALAQPERQARVLVVDDDPALGEMAAIFLRQAGMEVLCLNRPLQALEKASGFKPDLLLVDMHMPELNGMELARLLRQDPDFVLLPIVFMTADSDTQMHQQIQALGINALLSKPIQQDLLISTCQQALVSTNALKNRVARITQRSHQAHQITPGYFFAAVDEEIHSRNLGQHQSALYYLSPSSYADLVERLDKIELSALHEMFCAYLGEILGGDEHWVELSPLVACVLARRRSLQYHHQRGEQLSKHLSQHLYRRRGEPIRLSFSLGIVPLTPSLGSAHQALQAAEEAFELQTGQGRQRLGDSAPLPVLEESLDTATLPGDDYLNQLDINNDLSLAFQPIISLEDTRIAHFAVLTRLRRSDGELLPAAQFINRIERASKRLELDRWVLQKAVDSITQDSGTRENATLFIHLDKDTLSQKSFFSFAANVLRSSRLRGNGRLVFMLEEPWVLANPQQARQIALGLLDINCGICLTQAGSSNQTPHIIGQLPLHYLRLAPRLTGQAHDPVQLKAIVAAAKSYGVEVIATCIEDSHNLSSLWLLGIRLFEGFFIQPPDSSFHLQNDIIFAKEFVQQSGFKPG